MFCLHAHLRSGDGGEEQDHVDARAEEDPPVQLPEEAGDEGDEPDGELHLAGPPDVLRPLHLDAEDHGDGDDGGEGGAGDEGEGGEQERLEIVSMKPRSISNSFHGTHQGADAKERREDSRSWRLDPGGVVDPRAREGGRDGHGGDEGAQDVAHAEHQQLLSGVHRLLSH